MDHRPSVELLESIHSFPGVFQIKAIGVNENDFVARVLTAVQEEVATPSEIDHTLRETPDGKHVSLTLDVTVQSAEQVRAIWDKVHKVEGLKLLL
jgi:hypothetical protein